MAVIVRSTHGCDGAYMYNEMIEVTIPVRQLILSMFLISASSSPLHIVAVKL